MNRLGRIVAGVGVAVLTGVFPLVAQAQMVQRQEVIRATEVELRALLEGDSDGLRLDKVFFRDELPLPDGKVSWKVKTSFADLRAGRQNIPVEVSVNGRMEKVIQVAATFKQSTRYPVLRRALKRGETVTAADLKWVESEIERPPAGLVENPKELIGMTATRQVGADRPLQADWFAAPNVVARGERVQVVAVQGALRIESTAVAKSAGRMGEIVSLENTESHKRFDARITGPGRAEVLW
ncbi:MAG: flagellar basal body P-ring formation chaperone FlgA [Magnetococcus sp. YQC-9]